MACPHHDVCTHTHVLVPYVGCLVSEALHKNRPGFNYCGFAALTLGGEAAAHIGRRSRCDDDKMTFCAKLLASKTR